MKHRKFLYRMLVTSLCLWGLWTGRASAADGEAQQRVSAKDAVALRALVGRQATVFGRVTGTNVANRSGHHFLNFENPEFTVICFASDLVKFSSGQPAERYRGRDVEITGLVERYRDKLQIRLREPAQIRILASPPAKPGEPTAASKVELKKIGPETWLSPAGLTYQGRDPEGRTRVEHVLRHARDMPDRDGSHGVFDGGPEVVFGVIDEAWRNIERTNLRPTIEGDRSLYTVPLGRRVGYLGGRAGAARGHPPLTKVFLVIETGTQNVITAFPR